MDALLLLLTAWAIVSLGLATAWSLACSTTLEEREREEQRP